MRHILLLFLVFAVQGCMTFSKHPLSSAKVSDNTIFGKWSAKMNGNTSYLDIKPSKQKYMLTVKYEESNDHNGDEMIRLKGHISILDSRKYLNLKIIDAKDKFPDGYIFCQYHIDENALKIKFMNPEVIESAIRAKELKGKINNEGFFSYPIITQDQNGLRKFIVKYDDTLFGEEIKEAVFHEESLK